MDVERIKAALAAASNFLRREGYTNTADECDWAYASLEGSA